MDKDKRIKELEDELAFYKEDASAQFYYSLVKAIKHIQSELDNKTLNFDEDTFAKSVVTLSDKSAKIFEGLNLGKNGFLKTDGLDNDRKKKASKLDGQIAV